MQRIRKHSPIIALVIVLLVSYGFIGLMGYYLKNPPEYKQGFTPKDFEVPLPKSQMDFKQAQRVNRLPQFDEWYQMRSLLAQLPCEFQYFEYEYIGYYFVTAYCPEECGYNGSNYPKGWTTSTDTICHYSDTWSEPTTCAIDPKVRKYGDYILVGNPDSKDKKLYHAEDCGPGVQGKWIDCFRDNYSDMAAFPTGYYPCYLVRIKTKKIEEKGWFYKYDIFNSDLFDWCVSDRVPLGPCV